MVYSKNIAVLLTLLILFGCGGVSPDQKNQATSHYTLGLSHLQSGSPTMALKELLEAVKLNPNAAEIHAALAQAYQVKRAYPEAEQHYLKALSLSDNDPRYQNNLAALYIDMENWDKAIEYFHLASSNLLFMSTERALTGMGYAYFRKGDYPAAISAYNEARAIAPNYAPISLRLGELHYALGQDEAAFSAIEKAIEQLPSYAEAHYRMGLVYLRWQRLSDAAEAFRLVVELSPESEWGQKAAGILKTLQ